MTLPMLWRALSTEYNNLYKNPGINLKMYPRVFGIYGTRTIEFQLIMTSTIFSFSTKYGSFDSSSLSMVVEVGNLLQGIERTSEPKGSSTKVNYKKESFDSSNSV